MTVLLSPVGGVAAQFFDNNGNPLSGGKLFSYSAGTTTPAATFTSSLGITAHTNPIILDAGGRVPGGEIWLTDGVIYKFVLQTSTNVLIATYDNIVGINSNFVNYTTEQEIQTATAGQTVFNLTTTQYQPGTNSLTVYVDGVNQYGPGAQYAYLETDSDTVTFVSGLHVGASVKFTTATQTTGNATDASVVAYTPPFTGGVTTNVEDKLAQYVSVIDFGADPTGVADSTAEIQAALDASTNVFFPSGTYLVSDSLEPQDGSYLEMGDAILKASVKDWLDTGVISFASKSGLTIRGGVIDGQKAINPTGRVFGIKLTTAEYVVVDGMTLKNCPGSTSAGVLGGDGLYIGGINGTSPSQNVTVTNCKFIDNVRQGISIVIGQYIKIIGNEFVGTSGSDPGAGVDVEADNDSHIASDITIVGNTFTDNYYGVVLTTGCLRVAVVGNVFNGNRLYDIHLATGRLCTVTGNTIYHNPSVDGAHSILMSGGYTTVIADNAIQCTGQSNANQRNAIQISGGTGVSVRGNHIFESRQAAIQVGAFTLPANIVDIVVDGNVTRNCANSTTPVIFVRANSLGTFFPIRAVVRDNGLHDYRSGGSEAQVGISIDTTIPAAVSAAFVVQDNVIDGTVASYNTDMPLFKKFTWNPGTIASQASGSVNVALTGAALGDSVAVYAPYDMQDCVVSGFVSATDQATVVVANNTGSGKTFASSSSWRVRAVKPQSI